MAQSTLKSDPPAVTVAAPAAPSSMSRGMRETIEAVAIAFALAFLFKTFEAEAFVIPTGSMAPTLMGRHKDVTCPQCGYRYSASGSDEADRNGRVKADPNSQVVACVCPVCRYKMSVDPNDPEGRGHPSYSGDRIWVSKVPYHLMDPSRWDVVVFRYPEEAETYYIKRLVGLPNETVKVFHGDVYTRAAGAKDFEIERKPPAKLRAIAQIVHDNDCVSKALDEHDWPPRWQPWSEKDTPGDWQEVTPGDERSYLTDGSDKGVAWLRYQHIVPSDRNWIDDQWPPSRPATAQLITDFYAFNTRQLRREEYVNFPSGTLGMHWVGDLIVDCQLDVQSSKGAVLFDLVKGGRHFTCEIDVASGAATLSISELPEWKRTAQTNVRGAGSHRVMFANADRQLLLWIDDKVVTFDQPATYDELGNDRPRADARDRGDLAPVGIGSRGAELKVEHLRVLRDIYYIAARDHAIGDPITDYPVGEIPVPRSPGQWSDFLGTPSMWDTPRGREIFANRQPVIFELGADQLFVLGDNSPASADARLWRSQWFVDRDLLVGKALFVYWPHPLDLHIPFTDISLGVIPNFPGMGFIR